MSIWTENYIPFTHYFCLVADLNAWRVWPLLKSMHHVALHQTGAHDVACLHTIGHGHSDGACISLIPDMAENAKP